MQISRPYSVSATDSQEIYSLASVFYDIFVLDADIMRTDKANPAQSQLSRAGTTFMFTLFIRVVAGEQTF